MKQHHTQLVKTVNELYPSVFQHLFRLRVFFISSIKLNYFLHDPGLDGKGPIIQFWRGRERAREKTLQHARFLEEETFNTHSS